MNSFTYNWMLKVTDIIGKDCVSSPIFHTTLKDVSFSWKVFLFNIDEASADSSLEIEIVDGKHNGWVSVKHYLKVHCNANDSDVYERSFFETFYKNPSHEWSHSLPSFYTAIPDVVTIFHGDRIKITCQLYISTSTEMFSDFKSVAHLADRNSTSKMSLMMKDLFKNFVSVGQKDQLSDVKFISYDEKEFHCHRCILSAHTDVFKTMFSNENFRENIEPRIVTVDDIDGECLREVFRFIYMGNCNKELSPEMVMKCLYAAEKYYLPDMKIECISNLISSIKKRNVLDVLIESDKSSLDDVRKCCLHFIATNFAEIKALEQWSLFRCVYFELVDMILNVACCLQSGSSIH